MLFEELDCVLSFVKFLFSFNLLEQLVGFISLFFVVWMDCLVVYLQVVLQDFSLLNVI